MLPTWFAGVDVAWWENLKTFTIVLQRLHLRSKVHSPCTTKKTSIWQDFNPCCWSDSCLKFSYFDFTTLSLAAAGWDEIARRKVDGAGTIVSPTQVEWCYANWVTSSDERLVAQVYQNKGEHSIKHAHYFLANILVLQQPSQSSSSTSPTQFLPFHNKFRSHADQYWCHDSKQTTIWN